MRDLEKDYKVKLPDRAALNFYDSFAHTQFQAMQNQISTSQQNIDDARGHAMSMAADDQDTSRHAILQRAAQNAAAELGGPPRSATVEFTTAGVARTVQTATGRGVGQAHCPTTGRAR